MFFYLNDCFLREVKTLTTVVGRVLGLLLDVAVELLEGDAEHAEHYDECDGVDGGLLHESLLSR